MYRNTRSAATNNYYKHNIVLVISGVVWGKHGESRKSYYFLWLYKMTGFLEYRTKMAKNNFTSGVTNENTKNLLKISNPN